jgi:hypothetical protein
VVFVVPKEVTTDMKQGLKVYFQRCIVWAPSIFVRRSVFVFAISAVNPSNNFYRGTFKTEEVVIGFIRRCGGARVFVYVRAKEIVKVR